MTQSVLEVSKTYNALHELISAADLLKSRPGEVIDPLLEVVIRHSMHDRVGIRLLHRHNSLGPTEMMAESYAVDGKGFALITRAVQCSEIGDNYAPNSWIYTQNGFVPVEYSDRTLLSDPDINPQTQPDFFRDLAREINSLGVSDILGPSILGSALIEAYRPAGATVMIEFTAIDDRANVLRFLSTKDAVPQGTSIETHWCVSNAAEGDDEKKATKSCTKICPSIQNPPVHQGTYIHQQK